MRRVGGLGLLIAIAVFPIAVTLLWGDTIGPLAGGPLGLLFVLLAIQSFGLIGYVVARRRPDNPLGWCLLAVGLLLPLITIVGRVHIADDVPIIGVALVILRQALGVAAILTLILLSIALFPTGRLPGRPWRIAFWVAIPVVVLDTAFRIVADPGTPESPNLLFLGDLDWVPAWVDTLDGPIALVPLILLVAAFMAIVTPVWRWWRAVGRERSQTKWVALAMVIGLVLLFSPGPPLIRFALAISLFPAAMGIAILRDRLFDIDFLFSRTVLYGAVAVILVAAFQAIAFVVDRVAGPLREQSTLIQSLVAVSIAPAFRPVELRVRPVVDRWLPRSERLALLFSDMVSSTELAARLGDAAWRDLLDMYFARLRRELRAHQGLEMNTTGDGVFAAFREPAAAARCAFAILRATDDLPVRTRIGVHLGDCDVRGGEPAGVNVHVAARVMAAAAEGGIIVSESCRDMLVDEAFRFDKLGPRSLKGVPGEVCLFALVPTDVALAQTTVSALPTANTSNAS